MKSTRRLWTRPAFGYALAMDFKTIQIEEIDPANETYRISEDLDSGSVLDSLEKIGQLNPVLLLDRNPLKIIVCGFRRIRALRRLGRSRVLASSSIRK